MVYEVLGREIDRTWWSSRYTKKRRERCQGGFVGFYCMWLNRASRLVSTGECQQRICLWGAMSNREEMSWAGMTWELQEERQCKQIWIQTWILEKGSVLEAEACESWLWRWWMELRVDEITAWHFREQSVNGEALLSFVKYLKIASALPPVLPSSHQELKRF